MRWRGLTVAAAAAALVIGTAAPAAAKGADQATITGPGLAKPIVVGGDGEPGSGEALGQLADGSGLFVFMFRTDSTAGVRLTAAPAGDLGPKFTLAYRIPDGSANGSTFRQDLYPSAVGGPVTFAPAGQQVFGEDAASGWFRPATAFGALLTQLGVPGVTGPVATIATPTAQGEAAPKSTSSGHGWLIGGVIGGVLVIALGLVAVAARVRKRTAAQT